jgi:UDP-N-acetylglucosamine 2-epimerase (non-hydrolysing)
MRPPIKVLSVFGTRPEAIKIAPVLRAMRKQSDRFNSIACTTGQHRDMLYQVLESFEISVHHDLNVMMENQRLSELTARVITKVEEVLTQVRPDLLLVQGDTTTALAAALAAFYNRIPAAHIESGLRTGDMHRPFPEEANRILTDRLSSYCFAPTELNRSNLIREGIPPDRIYVTGNTVVDALLLMADKVRTVGPERWSEHWGTANEAILDSNRSLVLVTAHRRESFGDGLQAIYEAIRDLAHGHPDWEFVYPVHLNPNVQNPAVRVLSGVRNIHLLKPLAYEPFVYLMTRARLILTDSGGIQEEACSLGKPVIVMREKTERQEAVESGTVTLAGTDKGRIEELVVRFMEDSSLPDQFNRRPNPYGDGDSARRILDILWHEFRES